MMVAKGMQPGEFGDLLEGERGHPNTCDSEYQVVVGANKPKTSMTK